MARASTILDSSGRPMVASASLTEEVAGPSLMSARSIISGHPAQGLTPQRLAAILRAAEDGDATSYFELAEEMEEKDLHYLSVLGTRKRAVAQLPMTVEPADESAQAKEHAKVIEEWLDRDTLETELVDILDAVGKAVSYTEIIWDHGALWLPRQLKWRHPQWFEFDRIDGETPMLRGEGGQLVPLEYGKFICHVHTAKSGIPVRGGLARAVTWGWMFKNYSVKDWMSFLEMYGQPIRTGRFDPGASEGDIRKLMRAVAQIGTDAAAVFPRTMDIEFIDGKTGAAPAELWGSFAGYIDDQVSKAVVGQTSSSDAKAGGLGSGQADLHGEVREDIARADGKLLAATLNRDLVRPIIDLNFGPQAKYPRIKIEKPDAVDVKALVDSAERLAKLGADIDAEAVREQAGLPGPKTAGAKVLRVVSENPPQDAQEQPEAPGLGKKRSPAFLQPLRGQKTGNETEEEKRAAASGTPGAQDRDPIDNLTEEALGDWDSIFEELVDPIVEQLATATSQADQQRILAEAIGKMDPTRFAEIMTNAGFATHLAGEIDAAADELR